MNKTSLAQGNQAFRDKDYQAAIRHYRNAIAAQPELQKILQKNIELAQKRLGTAAPEASAPQGVAIDIVVPVYNALPDVQACLASLDRCRDGFDVRVIIVNDGSEAPTTDWLRSFAKGRHDVTLIEHASNAGYTRAVNAGLKASTAPFVITQNSDTIVTPGWLKGMVACMESDPRIGIVGPLSNAASWQNVPKLRNDQGEFAVNEVPNGLSVNDMAQVVARASRRTYPRLPFVNGFCFMIRRSVIEAIGYMDEETFPVGYGEENDFCIRAGDAGFELAIADDVYVFHAKSKSFGHERRKVLSEQGNKNLRSKHTREKLVALIEKTKRTDALDAVRERIAEKLSHENSNPLAKKDSVQVGEMSVDMHGVPIELRPRPVFAQSGYEVEPKISGPCLLIPFDGPINNISSAKGRPRVAVHLHLHYPDLLEEFIFFLKNIPFKYSLYVSISSRAEVESVAKTLSAELPLAVVEVQSFQNKGRDIAPFLVGFGSKILDHELICHIHSKRSPHNASKADWRRQLLTNLLGSPSIVASIVTTLQESKNIGLVFPEYHHSLRGQISWGTNYGVSQKLADRLGVQVQPEKLVLFPAGSMFWAKIDAIAPLLKAGLSWSDFPEETGQVDGTLAHAVERMLGQIAVATGFELAQVKSEKPHNLLFYHPRKWPYKPALSEAEMCKMVADYRARRGSSAKPRKRVAVYTALTGGYEESIIHERLAPEVDYIFFSDAPADDRGFWDIRPIPYKSERAVRRARHVKTNPHAYLSGYDIAVWIDANVIIRGDILKYVQLAIDDPDTPIFGIAHPHRNCIYEEAKAVVAAKKDDAGIVERQIARYRSEGYPTRQGLIETNLLVVNLTHPLSRRIFDEWWQEIDLGSHRDQLSLNFVLWKVKASWKPIFSEKITLRDSFDFSYLGHGRNSGYPALEINGARRVFA
jgi:GT2 family glycosyltransferase